MTEQMNRRCYDQGKCPFHKDMENKVNAALPRWAFLSAVTGALFFAAWLGTEIRGIRNLATTNKEIGIELKTKQDIIYKQLLNGKEIQRR